jgi:hypothetical protein
LTGRTGHAARKSSAVSAPGRGIVTRLVRAILDHSDLATVSSWSLRTTDAHGLYERFGFRVSKDGLYMCYERGS